MRHFYVIANYAKPHTLFCVQEIKEYLTAKGAECVIAGPAASDNGRYHYTDTGRIPGDTQCVIVLGGDGTLIQAAHDLKGTSYPLIGINLGKSWLSVRSRSGKSVSKSGQTFDRRLFY